MAGIFRVDQLQILNEQIQLACAQVGRVVDEVAVVAVSKTQTAAAVREAYGHGLRNFGENYVLEANEKIEMLSLPEIRWHFIGALQSNKIKAMADRFALIHSVDRLSVAKEIAKHGQARGSIQQILLQVNIGGENTKAGLAPEALPRLLDEIQKLPGVQITGLMTMPPLATERESSRKFFRSLRQLREKSARLLSGSHHLRELSMGTSQDFTVAIEEGSTLIRVGTLLFGERKKP